MLVLIGTDPYMASDVVGAVGHVHDHARFTGSERDGLELAVHVRASSRFAPPVVDDLPDSQSAVVLHAACGPVRMVLVDLVHAATSLCCCSTRFARTSAAATGGQTLLPHMRTWADLLRRLPLAVWVWM